MRYRHLKPAGRQQPPGRGVEGPDRRYGGTARPGLAGQLGRAQARGRPRGGGAVAAGHEHLAIHRDRGSAVHVFTAAIDRDGLIGRRLQSVAEKLCGGSWTPLLTHLVQSDRLSAAERRELRQLIDELDRPRPKPKGERR